MTNRVDGTIPFSNSNVQESKEYVYVFPYPIFEKAVQPIAATRPLAEVTQLTNKNFEESLQNALNSLTKNAEHYEGPLVDGKRQGKGQLWLNGNKYEGEFFNDLPEGYGTFIYNTGITYVGQFNQGKYHGNGTLIIPNEGKYVGEFKDGLFDGFGTFRYSNGDTYTGNYIKGIRQDGVLYYIAGGSYAGEYKNSKRHGQGTLTSAAGDVYVGGFKDGLRDGYGEVIFADGSPTIKGWFENDLCKMEF